MPDPVSARESADTDRGAVLRWRLQLSSSVDRVFELLSTDTGRECYWANGYPDNLASMLCTGAVLARLSRNLGSRV